MFSKTRTLKERDCKRIEVNIVKLSTNVVCIRETQILEVGLGRLLLHWNDSKLSLNQPVRCERPVCFVYYGSVKENVKRTYGFILIVICEIQKK